MLERLFRKKPKESPHPQQTDIIWRKNSWNHIFPIEYFYNKDGYINPCNWCDRSPSSHKYVVFDHEHYSIQDIIYRCEEHDFPNFSYPSE